MRVQNSAPPSSAESNRLAKSIIRGSMIDDSPFFREQVRERGKWPSSEEGRGRGAPFEHRAGMHHAATDVELILMYFGLIVEGTG